MLLKEGCYDFVIHPFKVVCGVSNDVGVVAVASGRDFVSVCQLITKPELPELFVHLVHDYDEEERGKGAALLNGFVERDLPGNVARDISTHRDTSAFKR